MKNIKHHFFLFLSLLTFLAAGLSFFFIEKSSVGATADTYLSNTQTKVLEAMRAADEDLTAVKARITATKGVPEFSQMQITGRYPYYVYKVGQLVYWADHRFVPDYARVAGGYTTKVFDWDKSKFIAKRMAFAHNGEGYEVVSLINLYRHYDSDNQKYLQSGYNTDLFPIMPEGISLLPDAQKPHNIQAEGTGFLFSVTPPKPEALKNQTIPNQIVLLGALALCFLGIYFLIRIYQNSKVRKYEAGFFLLAGFLLLMRVIMLYFSIPFVFNESDLFNSAFYAYNDFTPSLGDLLLNIIVAVILLTYLTVTYYHTKSYYRIINTRKTYKLAMSIVLVILSYGVMLWVYRELSHIYTYSQYQLDIKLNIGFMENPLKLACMVVFILLSTVYFLSLHLLVSLFIRINRNRKETWKIGLLAFVIGSVVMVALCVFKVWCNPLLLGLNAVYFVVLYVSQYPRFLYNFRYQTTIYFFIGALICASIATYVVYKQEIQKDFELKLEYGKKYLAETDDMAEMLISKASANITADEEVKKIMFEPAFPQLQLQEYIKKNLLEPYLDNYKLDVYIFGKNGISVEVPVANADGTSPNSFEAYQQRYSLVNHRTRYANLYFYNDATNNFMKEYWSFMKVSQADSSLAGYLVMNLHQSEATPQTSVFTLLDTKLEQTPETAHFSYALYDNNKGLSVSGGQAYNYEKRLPSATLKDKALYETGLTIDDHKHVGIKSQNGRTIVVSSKEQPFEDIYSNFSYLFLLLVVSIIFIMIVYAVRYGFSKLNINFATKIQIYLNVAFLLPLILVVGITLNIISNTIRQNKDNENLGDTKTIYSSFQKVIDDYSNATASLDYLEQQLQMAAQKTGRDISLYDNGGKLISTSKVQMFDKGILSKCVNPEAYTHIIEDKEDERLIPETLGSLNYSAAYIKVKGFDGRPLGIASVPFYDSKAAFEKQVMKVIGSILNTFTSIFIVLLLLSYFASNMLTVPLRMITQKLRRINLDKLNEPLQWKSDDEIGLLIGEYNKMLLKLQESKDALSTSEKQTAWREMAKQVAHEIKNPLTPMKLNLQMIQRMLDTDNPRAKTMMARTINSLIDQIDNISDIANSFSDFARMPIPKTERFDLVKMVQNAVAFHDDEHIQLTTSIPTEELLVAGDRQMLSRIITNLILNGVQAVPAWRKPEIHVNVAPSPNRETVTIEVKDNGTGIPDSLKNKIFMPNFSTKKEGSGVGLAVAKRGVEHAGGSIWFDTTTDGTTFYINLMLLKGI